MTESESPMILSKELAQHAKGSVKFIRYRQGNLFYKTCLGLEFAVPIEDTGDATFPSQDKGIFYLRWINRRLNAT